MVSLLVVCFKVLLKHILYSIIFILKFRQIKTLVILI